MKLDSLPHRLTSESTVNDCVCFSVKVPTGNWSTVDGCIIFFLLHKYGKHKFMLKIIYNCQPDLDERLSSFYLRHVLFFKVTTTFQIKTATPCDRK